jgi:hypothetical protein
MCPSPSPIPPTPHPPSPTLLCPATPRPQAHSLDEVEQFVGISSALLINMGTLSSDWVASKKLAARRVGLWGWGRAQGCPLPDSCPPLAA